MSDLGNGGRPNSMKLGEDIDLDEFLLKFSFICLLGSVRPVKTSDRYSVNTARAFD